MNPNPGNPNSANRLKPVLEFAFMLYVFIARRLKVGRDVLIAPIVLDSALRTARPTIRERACATLPRQTG
jgi:hypothetical protein